MGKDGKYCADEGNKIICDRSAIGSWEKFKVGKVYDDGPGPGTGTGPGKLYYGGDSNLGRDGRDACSMTDDDKKYACNNDSELVGIGSGPTCGHKYYITDKGQGHISSPNERYYKFYSCAKKDYNKLSYGGDSNLGRDGRDACNMTDDDKKYACDNDSELVGIGSGPTCGHKYYITDKGQGHISGTDERYSKFYSCAKNGYI